VNAALRLVLASSCLALGGCAWLRGMPEPAPEIARVPLAADDPFLAGRVLDWEDAVAGRSGVRGGVALQISGPDGSQRLDQNVVVVRPARLRMEIQAFLVTAAVLVVDGGRYDYYQSIDKIRDAGPVYPRLLFDIAGVPLTLDQAIHFLLGGPPPRRGLAPAAGWRESDGAVEVDLHDAADRLVRRLRFDGEGRLTRAEERSPSGELRWQVDYDRYRQVGGQPFATRIEFEFPAYASRARVAFRSVELDPDTPDALFRIELSDDEEVSAR
jgi:hypothetical protein